MSFSILFEESELGIDESLSVEPAFFSDLNLDQIVASITAWGAEYHLQPFFYIPLTSTQSVSYRHEVFRDLQDPTLHGYVEVFGHSMQNMRNHLAQAKKLHDTYQRQRWFLHAVGIYCDAVGRLDRELKPVELKSRGFRSFRAHLAGYARSQEFVTLADQVAAIKAGLSTVRYCVRIVGNRVDVTRYDGQVDYSVDVAAAFEKFRRVPAKSYLVKFAEPADMNHVEVQVLGLAARLHPEVFTMLTQFCTEHRDYLETTIKVFDREVQFYVSYLAFVGRVETAGLSMCYPKMSGTSKEESATATFDLALAAKLVPTASPVVCNNFYLHTPERIFVVSGPNQGGKTTFARTFGQLHYLARLGCPVPGREAQLFLYDKLFTHFERQEDLQDLNGKLQSDLMRIHEILTDATERSVIVMNEIFNSTTLQDARLLGTEVLQKIIALGSLCVCVTFIDELAGLGEAVVSMVGTVVPERPAERTYLLERRPADGLSYAVAIAAKYGLTYTQLKERLAS